MRWWNLEDIPVSDPDVVPFTFQASSLDPGRDIGMPSTFLSSRPSPLLCIGMPSARFRSSSCMPPSESDSDSVSEMRFMGPPDMVKMWIWDISRGQVIERGGLS